MCALSAVYLSTHLPACDVTHISGSEQVLLRTEKSPLFTSGQGSLACWFQSTPFSEKESQSPNPIAAVTEIRALLRDPPPQVPSLKSNLGTGNLGAISQAILGNQQQD